MNRLDVMRKAMAFTEKRCGVEFDHATIVRRLHRDVLQRKDDLFSSINHVASACGWDMPDASTLIIGLSQAGYIVRAGDTGYYCVTALRDAHGHTIKAWRKKDPEGYAAVSSRAVDPVIVDSHREAKNIKGPKDKHMSSDLFGNPLEAGQKINHITAMISVWMEIWKGKYGREYPLDRQVETAFLKRILGWCDGRVDDAIEYLRQFITSTDRFLIGHPLALAATHSQRGRILARVRQLAANGSAAGRGEGRIIIKPSQAVRGRHTQKARHDHFIADSVMDRCQEAGAVIGGQRISSGTDRAKGNGQDTDGDGRSVGDGGTLHTSIGPAGGHKGMLRKRIESEGV